MSLIFAIAFLAITVVWPRKFADTSSLHKATATGFVQK